MNFNSDPLFNRLYADFKREALNWGPTGISPGSDKIRSEERRVGKEC